MRPVLALCVCLLAASVTARHANLELDRLTADVDALISASQSKSVGFTRLEENPLSVAARSAQDALDTCFRDEASAISTGDAIARVSRAVLSYLTCHLSTVATAAVEAVKAGMLASCGKSGQASEYAAASCDSITDLIPGFNEVKFKSAILLWMTEAATQYISSHQLLACVFCIGAMYYGIQADVDKTAVFMEVVSDETTFARCGMESGVAAASAKEATLAAVDEMQEAAIQSALTRAWRHRRVQDELVLAVGAEYRPTVLEHLETITRTAQSVLRGMMRPVSTALKMRTPTAADIDQVRLAITGELDNPGCTVLAIQERNFPVESRILRPKERECCDFTSAKYLTSSCAGGRFNEDTDAALFSGCCGTGRKRDERFYVEDPYDEEVSLPRFPPGAKASRGGCSDECVIL